MKKFPSKKWLLFTCYGYPHIPNSSFGFEFLQQLPQISVVSGKRKKNAAFRRRWPHSDLHHLSALRNEPQVGSSFHKSIHLSQSEFGHTFPF